MSGSRAKDAEAKKIESNEETASNPEQRTQRAEAWRNEEKGGGSLDEAASKSHQ